MELAISSNSNSWFANEPVKSAQRGSPLGSLPVAMRLMDMRYFIAATLSPCRGDSLRPSDCGATGEPFHGRTCKGEAGLQDHHCRRLALRQCGEQQRSYWAATRNAGVGTVGNSQSRHSQRAAPISWIRADCVFRCLAFLPTPKIVRI